MQSLRFLKLIICIQQLLLLVNCHNKKIKINLPNEELNGKLARVSIFHYPPFITMSKEKDGNTTYSGYCFKILEWLARTSNLKMTFVPVNRSDITKYGITQALINQLVVKEVDVIPMVLIPTVERTRMMDFTIPLLIGNNRLMLRYPEEENQLTAIARPFPTLVWTLLALSIVALIGTMVLFHCFQYSIKIRLNYSVLDSISKNTLFIISVFTGQGFYLSRKLSPTIIRISIALWCLVALVICNAYTGTLTSFLTVPKFKPVINSLQELAASNRYKLTAEFNAAFTDTFLKATSGYYKNLGDSLRQNQHLLYRDYGQAVNNVLKHDAVLLRGGIDILTRISEDIQANGGKCRLMASKPMGDILFLSFGLSKEFGDTQNFNNKLITLWESGLLTYWFTRHVPNIDKCLITTQNVAKVKTTKLSTFNIPDVSGIFLILIVGQILSFLVFLGELGLRVFKMDNN